MDHCPKHLIMFSTFFWIFQSSFHIFRKSNAFSVLFPKFLRT
uniref:Uncharacterized protein n=1 Tax=Arundo donax TaxID=35708 RepID=A0A0A8Z7C8_ARUDO